MKHLTSRPRKRYDPLAVQRGNQAVKVWQDGQLYNPKRDSRNAKIEEFQRLVNHVSNLKIQLSVAVNKGRSAKAVALSDLLRRTQDRAFSIAEEIT